MNIDQMKRAIHIRCTQQFLYFESHKKSLKQLCTHYCLFQCTFYLPHLQYQHILLTRKKFQEMNDIGYMYKQWLNNIFKHKQRVHYICVYLGINRYSTCTEKEHYNCLKYTWEFVFFTFVRIACYLEYTCI